MADIVPITTANPDLKARLRAWIRSKGPGGCRMLSRGDACTCPICDVDDLCDELCRVAAEREVLRGALRTVLDEMDAYIQDESRTGTDEALYTDLSERLLPRWADKLRKSRA